MAGMPGEQPPAKGLPGPEAAWQDKETTDHDAKRGAAAGSSARGTGSTTRPAHSSSKSTTTSERAREHFYLSVSKSVVRAPPGGDACSVLQAGVH